MKQLLLLRLWSVVQFGAAIFGLCLVADLLMGAKIPVEILIFGVTFLPISLPRSSWFFNVRCSRWRLALYIVLEATLHSCVAYILVHLFYIYLRLRNHVHFGEYEELTSWFCAIMGVVSVLMPIRNPVAAGGFDPLHFVRSVVRRWPQAVVAVAMGFGWYYLWKEAPLWYLGVVLSMVVFGVSGSLRSIILPQHHYIEANRVLRTAAGIIFVFIPLLSWAALRWSPPGRATEYSFLLLEGLPKVELSESRTLEIARSPATTSWRGLSELSESSKKEISFQEWKARTAACEWRSCMDLSDRLIPRESWQDLERFEVLLQKCDLTTDRGTTSCNGILPYRAHLERWFKVLRGSPQLREWLNSENPVKRYAALKSLIAEKISPEAMDILKTQRDAPDRMLASVAASVLEYHSGAARWAGHCEEGKLPPDAKAFCERLRDGDWSRF